MAANPYDLTTRELLSILFRERLKLILVFFGLCVLVVAYSYTLTPYYEATTRLLVKTGREFQTRSDPNQPVVAVPSSTKQEIVNSEIQILTSRDLAQAVIDRIGADKLYPGASADIAVRRFPERSQGRAGRAGRRHRHLLQEPRSRHRDRRAERRRRALSAEARRDVQRPALQIPRHADEAIPGPARHRGKKEAEIRSAKSLFDVDAQRAKLLDDRAATTSILQQLRSQSIDAHQRIDFLHQPAERPRR